ncbi:ricin-type beta-trefoil lectin domain protein [Kitasatospora sp. NPDC048298]|uniref:ricin-type beta-trefoil lectin domain protein n=1 Tax=Kitasatospora sp. NPDC048298 TaxID=3364049 RepID=UPI003722D857
MSKRAGHARHGGPGVLAAVARRRVPVAATAVALVAGSVLAVSASAAGPADAAVPAAAQAPRVKAQQWIYPGPAGSPTCSAPAEYADGRLANGVLQPEYYTIDGNGGAVLLSASDPDYACNGYSPANVADVKAHSAQQYMTVSLADLAAERKLTGDPAKTAAAVQTLTDFTRKIGFAGVDIDFENYWDWSAQDAENFFGFITALSDGLHGRGLKLQVEGPPDTTTRFDYGRALTAGADQVVMMAYDYQYQSPAGATCLPFAPYDWARDLFSGALAQIPADQRSRFVAGLPSEAYTASDQCRTVKGNQTVADMKKAPGYSEDPAVIAQRRDPASGEIRWSSGGRFYDYVDQTALDSKLKVATDLGITEVSVWALGGGNAWFSPGALGGGPAGHGLVSKASGRCMNAPSSANLARLEVRDCDGSAGEAVAAQADGTLRVYGKCVDASGRKTTPGTPVILYTCNGGTNQQWQPRPDGSFVGGQSGLCLDVTGGAVPAPDGTQLELWQCTGQSNQIWTAV